MKSLQGEKIIDRYADGVTISPRRRQKAAIIADIIDKLSYDNPLQIVDFGCADGAIPYLLLNSEIAKSIFRITGITLLNYNDLPNKPAFYHPRFTRMISDIEGDLANITLPWGQCDIVTATAFFHYLKNPVKAFQHAANLLKPDGYLIITIPVRWVLAVKKTGFPGLMPSNNFIRQIISLDDWGVIAESAGFEEIERSAIQWAGMESTFKIEDIFRKNQIFINLSTNFMVIYKKINHR